ncbi:hypothetical protein ACX0AN_002094 [Acinetobacter baumannii]|uniref:hypothetical protein n=1 Tax=Acinetobacter baumannii TaxID=470 RepID=UPI0002BC238F|nr:hypothetical protein [Acinetobacter baumannii]EHU3239619.1 hypothetical protein [Acinetobacter baumannii]EJB8458882.1 hypothetical protein [Acinetobacter baumannii]EJB8474643.1 hypothetical protein [Acinetobacter baumannii]EJB8549663.1 hypothetical protein [Acinetobacter baumannii]EJB8566430.1 hypothetical protein [Acinetobacter baumannii]
MEKIESFACRVCGLIQDEEPWGENGENPNFAICGCCGTEFGYEDCTRESVKANRKRWLVAGANWWALKEKPQDWDIEKQLQNIPASFK